MYRPQPQIGIGNIFIHLSTLDDKVPISKTVYDGFRGKYLDFKNMNIIEDDGSLENVNVNIYLNPYTFQNVHPNIRRKIEPSIVTKSYLEEYKHLIEGVDAGMCIRIGKVADNDIQFINEYGLKIINEYIEKCNKIFITCDVLEYKYKLKEMFGEKITFLDMECVMSRSENTIDSPAPYIEFFLLSMCPFIYTTGSRDIKRFSTFAYMASVYGNKQLAVIIDD